MTEVLKRHPSVRDLFDNSWLHLIAVDDRGKLAWRYTGNLEWIPFEAGSDNQTATAAE